MKNIFLGLAFATLLAGCTYGYQKTTLITTNPTTNQTSTVAIPAGSTQLTGKDNGKTINIAVDQTLAISLESNASTGYSWNLVTTPNPVTITKVSADYQASPAASGMVGSGGQEIWQFKALKVGETDLKLAYAHAWEVAQSTSGEFSIHLIVK